MTTPQRLAEALRKLSFLAVSHPHLWAKEYSDALIEYDAQPTHGAGGVPDGWKLVPIDTTEDMRCAASDSEAMNKFSDEVSKTGRWPYSLKECAEFVSDIYLAMLSAAPSPPASKFDDFDKLIAELESEPDSAKALAEARKWVQTQLYGKSGNQEVQDGNVERVRSKLSARSAIGTAKYGVTTERQDLSREDWLKHLQEELLDATVYVEAALNQEVQQPVAFVPVHPRTGPLWANAIATLDSDHPASYPLMKLYAAQQPMPESAYQRAIAEWRSMPDMEHSAYSALHWVEQRARELGAQPLERMAWTLISRDGSTFTGSTPLACASAEINSRVPATVQMERIFRALDEDAGNK